MSFKSLAASGAIKKTDLFRVKLDDLKVEKGFNLRLTSDPEVKEHINGMVKSLLSGTSLPPLEVRVTDDDMVVIVDGHCRHQAYLTAKAAGAGVEWIDCMPFRGNDVDRVVKMIASSQGLSLTPLQRAMGFKRLRAMGVENNTIADSVGKSTEHVRQLLMLADANSDVHAAINAGTLSAHMAIDLVQKHGEKAGEQIAKLLGKAKENGKTKVTKATASVKLPPRAALQSMVEIISSQHSSESTKQLLAQDKGEFKWTVTFTGEQLRSLLGIKAAP